MGANAIVGGGPPLVWGAAFLAQHRKTGGVAPAFVGDGGSDQGTTRESHNLAKVWSLEAISVIEDPADAESTALSVGANQVGRARGSAFGGVEVAGYDVFAVRQAAREAIEKARGGGGPTLLHVKFMCD